MWDWRVWNELLREITREARFAVQHEVERFIFALEDWTNALVSRPLPADWRQQTAVFLFHWELEGFQLTPRRIAILDWWIDAWAKRRGWLPKSGEATSARAPQDETSEEASRQAEPQADVSTAERIVQVSEPQPRKSANSWPALTPAEEKAAQEGTDLPWWYPVQPRNRLDSVWQKQFENLGQVARDQLLVFFREVAALGRMSRAIADPEDADVDSLLAQQRRVQEAYDRYLQTKIDIHREWTRYLSTEWFIGPEVLKLFEKIDNALPDRVEGFQSPLNDKLKTARRASYEATNKKVRRTDAAYTALVWTDNVIAIIEFATLLGSAKAVFTQTAKKMVAKGLSRAAARGVAVAYTAAHLGTAAASAVVIGGVVPKVLVDAGLDEADVRAGLAVFRALFTIVGIRAVGKQRKGTRRTPPKENAGENTDGLRWDRTHPLIEGVPDARRTPEHTYLQRAVAEEMRATGGYTRVGMGRPLSEFSGRRHTPDIQPDDIGLTMEGRIDMFEIMSPRQSRKVLEDKLKDAMNQLPPEMRGGIRVIDPGDAFK